MLNKPKRTKLTTKQVAELWRSGERMMASHDRTWTIEVYGYGAFLFKGTEKEAEEMREHKAIWEGGAGRKRLATPEEIASGEAQNILIQQPEVE